ncbi:MAG: hypothetical protein R6U93_01300 [Dehalococcoidia bacterium]
MVESKVRGRWWVFRVDYRVIISGGEAGYEHQFTRTTEIPIGAMIRQWLKERRAKYFVAIEHSRQLR